MKIQYLECGGMQLVHGGREYFDLLKKLISSAKNEIYLQTYIFSDDTTGNEITEELIAAVKKGVKVYVLVDGFASQSLPDEFIANVRSAGVEFRFFEPLFRTSNFYFGRRLHHKVCVVDAETAIVCGLNISDRYNDMPEQRAWFDMGMLVEGGPAKELASICQELWERKKKIFRKKFENRYVLKKNNNCYLRICRNDWVMGSHDINKSYQRLIGNAKGSVTLMCSYFLPGNSIRNRLRIASRKGVKIKVILAGTSDIYTVKYAERYLYRWLLRHHVEIYEYQPSILHAKLGIADMEMLSIGSYNINDLSANASIELNLEVNNPGIIRSFHEELELIMKNDCIKVEPKQINIYSFKHLLQFLSYYFIRFILKLGTFYFKKQE